MNFNLHFGELHSDNSINYKNNFFENYIPKCYKVKRIIISFNCFSEYICLLGNFSCLFCCLLIFFKINFFEKFLYEYHQCQSSDPDQTRHSVRTNLVPNCLQKLSADDTRRQSGKKIHSSYKCDLYYILTLYLMFVAIHWLLPVLGLVEFCLCGFMSWSTPRLNWQWFWF